MWQLRLYLLGRFQAELNGTMLRLPTDKLRALLAYCVLEADRPHHREHLANLLWSNWQDENALRNFRQALYRLRGVFDTAIPGCSDQLFTVTRNEITFHSSHVWSDVTHLQQALRAVKTTDLNPLSESPAWIESLATLLTPVPGELLAAFHIDDAPEFENWLSQQRASLKQQMSDVLTLLSDFYARGGDSARALTITTQHLQLDPWCEAAHRQKMHLLAATGRKTEALAYYQTWRAKLTKEFGEEPEAASTELYANLATQQSLTKVQYSFQNENQSLSQGRISIGNSASPLDLTLTTRKINNLPNPLTRFVGRRNELPHLRTLLTEHRLLTLTGTGGAGKTRLAIELGQQMQPHFSDGVCWVELAEVSNGLWVTKAVAATLEIAETPEQPLQQILIDTLRTSHRLLIFDNCEHLLTSCAQLVDFLLQRCPSLSILTTSREALAISGEAVWIVPPLPVPPAHQNGTPYQWLEFESVQLLLDRMQRQESGLPWRNEEIEAIIEICRSLDGIPLALELAAARARSLSLPELVPYLYHRFELLNRGNRAALPRQQTLRALLDWSHDLLTWPERLLLRRLSIFAGSWTLASAEQICSDASSDERVDRTIHSPWASIGDEPIVDLLARLVEKSLVILRDRTTEGQSFGRYRMLDTIRAYAHEHLLRSGEWPRLRLRHAQVYTRLACQSATIMFSRGEVESLGWFETEHENLRTVLQWTLESEQPVETIAEQRLLGIQLAAALAYFWDAHNYLSDGTQWLEKAWSAVDATTPLRERAQLSSALGTLHWKHTRYYEAQRWHQSALSLFRQENDWRGVALSYHHLAVSAMCLDQPEDAISLFQKSIRTAEVNDDSDVIALAWVSLGGCYLEMEAYEEAISILQQGASLAQTQQMPRIMSYAAARLVEHYLSKDDFIQALECIQQIEEGFRLTKDPALLLSARVNRAELVRRQGQLDRAIQLWRSALHELDMVKSHAYEIQVLEDFCTLVLQLGDPAVALLLLTACQAHRLTHMMPRAPFYQRTVDALMAYIAEMLTPAVQQEIRAQGDGMSFVAARLHAQHYLDSYPLSTPSNIRIAAS